MTALTRRAALAGAVASVPVLALPAVAVAAVEPRDDAVYAAIERHQEAMDVFQEAWELADDRGYDRNCGDAAAIASVRAANAAEMAEEEAFESLLATVPTTRAGAFASAEYVSQVRGATIMPSHQAYVAMLLKSPLVVQ